MSAIGGIIYFDGRRVDQAVVQNMVGELAPYGRASPKVWYHKETAFFSVDDGPLHEDHRSDHSAAKGDSKQQLLFDGQLHNPEEVGSVLGLNAAKVRTISTTELVSKLILKKGLEVVDRLRGDFALSVWDSANQQLWLCRDALGVRPLYWHRGAAFIAFASLPRALLVMPEVPRILDKDALHDHLCGLSQPAGRSFFKDIHRVGPGQLVRIRRNGVEAKRYFCFTERCQLPGTHDQEYIEMFRHHLNVAVQRRIKGSHLSAVELSSGLDSAAVTAVAAEQLRVQSKKIIAITVVPINHHLVSGPPGYHTDESDGAGKVAQRFSNVDHRLVQAEKRSLLDILCESVDALDCPPASPIYLGWRHVIQLEAIRHGCDQLLCADSGNVSISYEGWNHLPRLLGSGRWIRLWSEVAAAAKIKPEQKATLLLRQSIRPHARNIKRILSGKPVISDERILSVAPMTRDLMKDMNSRERMERSFSSWGQAPWSFGVGERASYFNRLDPGDYNLLDNRAGLSRSDPTSDRDLVEFCLSVPERLYWGHGEEKWIFKKAFESFLPRESLFAKTRGYQGADWFALMHDELPRYFETLQSIKREGSALEYVDIRRLEGILEHWKECSDLNKVPQPSSKALFFKGLTTAAFIIENS